MGMEIQKNLPEATMKDEFIATPRYEQIAIDLANRIAREEFIIGTKLQGRSSLAGKYNVSPETVRRAIKLLEAMDIVEVIHGSGIIVKSITETYKFIEEFRNKESMTSIKKDISNILEEKNKLEKQLTSNIDKLIDYSQRFKNSNPFAPMELEVKHNSLIVGKTISDVKFWQNTGATIIGIKRVGALILSPGPFAVFTAGDILVLIGEDSSYERVRSFLSK